MSALSKIANGALSKSAKFCQRTDANSGRSQSCTGPSNALLVNRRKLAHSISSCSAALIRISGLPLYISIRPVVFTFLPSMSETTGDFETGDVGGIQPVNVWLG